MRVIALTILFGALFVAASSEAQGAAKPGAVDWPFYRGDAAMSGVADTSLPAKPELLWSFKTGGPIKSSPVISQNRVFIGSDDGNVYAIGLADGKKAWAFKADAGVEAPPVVHGNSVVFGSTGTNVFSVKADTGEKIWHHPTDDKVIGGANIVAINGRLAVLFGGYDNRLHSLDLATGKTNWSYETGPPRRRGCR